ncbi:MAG: glycosyltransferase [Bacteroidales bacterium]|jgi:glycosyltransferase involved in cell wall biosynthesis
MNTEKKEILLSVFMITYNQEKYIANAIESVLMQITDFDYEIVIGEDCSTDRTRDICIRYAQKHPGKIKLLLSESNLRVMPNFIRTLLACTGKYIAMCDGDDYWTDPCKLQKQVDFLEANPDFSLCFHDVLLSKNNEVIGKYVQKQTDVFTTNDLFDRHFIATCSIVFRNNIYIPEWFAKIASGDRALLFLCSLKGKLKLINEVMGVYRLHSGGISNQHFGVKKVYDTAYLFNLFDEYTNFHFTQKCYEGLTYEIETHIISKYYSNCSSNDNIESYSIIKLIKIIIKRIIRKFFTPFKN